MGEVLFLNATGQPMTHRERFLFERRSGIGGSDVAAIMGFSKWKSAYSVWEDKLGISADDYDNDAMKWGRALEPVIRQEYAARNSCHVYDMTSPLRNPAYPELVANADGAVAIAAGMKAYKGLEIKTARYMDEWGADDTDEIPYSYLLQVNHYMLVAGVKEWDVAVLFQGSTYRQYTIRANAELQALIYEACRDFWAKYVKTGIAPPPQTYQDCVARWGGSEASGELVASTEVERATLRLAELKAQAKVIEDEQKIHSFTITEYMRDRSNTLVRPDGTVLATWKLPSASTMVDTEALAKRYPEAFAACQKERAVSRRLLTKKITA